LDKIEIMITKHTLLLLITCCLSARAAYSQDNEFKSIFDGQSLQGWSGDEKLWRVEDGAIVGETTADRKIDVNNFLAWDYEVDDFELRLKFRISGQDAANSGVQFRSQVDSDGHVSGYQADIDRSGRYIGILYDEKTGRGILAQRGEKVVIDSDGKKEIEPLGDAAEILSHIKLDDWNEYSITALGDHFVLKINGHETVDVTDRQADHFDRKGRLAFQLHVGPPMKVEFKDIQLKRLPLAMDQKKIVFIAGTKSHGWNQHEHNAGCLLLAKRLNKAAAKNGLPVVTTVYRNGWPADPTALDNADTVVCYCDGGDQHYLNTHGDQFEDVMRRGVGLVCLHYGVEVPQGISGQRFLNWIGGYFELNWSVNPHWTAKFDQIPEHEITRGVEPFELNDEWYYHMRFVPEMSRVTPILTAMPPVSSLSRPDGPHEGNPDVRKAILEDMQPQHLAWAFVRGDGIGRGFGFTGGHFHYNWENDNFRKIVLNAIVWTAHVEVPANGVESSTPDKAEIEANQDYPKPGGLR
jgi:type 1 glutamine amidotransferase